MVEGADIFRLYGPPYRATCGARMPPSHRQALADIEDCRTAALGGHVDACEHCQESQYSYHACTNRHGPTGQNDRAHQWLDTQREFLLPVPHFLVPVTVPDGLRALARSHQNILYPTLFRSSAAAVQQLASDSRCVGGHSGMVGMLHTWTRDLRSHPHGHSLVPGGGLSADGRAWLPSRAPCLVPVKPLSMMFRAKCRAALPKTTLCALVPPDTWDKDGVVHSESVGRGGEALPYLAPYMFRVAISPNRLLTLAAGKVTFQEKASATGQTQGCTVTAAECMRRFLPHVLPDRCVKVR